MPTLPEVLREYGGLEPADVEWLRLLVGDWQLLADLSFADLVLWIRRVPPGAELPAVGSPPADTSDWVAAAHVRPTTGRWSSSRTWSVRWWARPAALG